MKIGNLLTYLLILTKKKSHWKWKTKSSLQLEIFSGNFIKFTLTTWDEEENIYKDINVCKFSLHPKILLLFLNRESVWRCGRVSTCVQMLPLQRTSWHQNKPLWLNGIICMSIFSLLFNGIKPSQPPPDATFTPPTM